NDICRDCDVIDEMKQCRRDRRLVVDRWSLSEISVSQPRSTSVDLLEPRRLLAASVANATLIVTGTSKNDVISLFIDATDPSQIDVKINKKVTEFARDSYALIYINGRDGDDQITLAENNGAILNATTV